MSDSWVTDTRWIDEEEIIWSVFSLKKVYTARSGISYEIFEKNGSRASLFLQKDLPNIAERQNSVHVNKGARVFRVKLNPVNLELKGTFQTMDLRDRDYQIEITVQVSNPALFAESFYRGDDPISMIQEAILGRVHEYAERTDSNQIDKFTLRHHVQSALYEPEYHSLGVMLVRVGEFRLSLADHELGLRNAWDEEEINDVHHTAAFRRSAQEKVGETYIQQLQEKIARGRATKEDLKFLLGTSHRGAIIPEPKQLKEGNRGERSDRYSRRPKPLSSARPPEDSSQEERPGSVYRDARLGVSFELHTLSREEQADLELNHNTIFKVRKVDEDGRLANHLQEGDLILKIENQTAHDIPTLQRIIKQFMDKGGDSLAIRIDRDERSYEWNIPVQ